MTQILTRMHEAGAVKRHYTYNDVDEVLSPKSTNTILLRASSTKLFIKFCDRVGKSAFPVKEETAIEYLREALAIPTRGRKFVDTLVFMGCLFGLAGANASESAQVQGLAYGGLKRKRPTVKRPPIPARVVMSWEKDVVLAAGTERVLEDQELSIEVLKGHFLWLVHTRTRFGDAARLKQEPKLDLAADGTGYIEASATWEDHKTGRRVSRAGQLLPMVGLARGASGAKWASAWLALRRRAGLRAEVDGTLAPELLTNGSFGQGRMKTGDAIAALRSLLQKEGVGDHEKFGTHSFKATMLSWCAKAGVGTETRKILGYHSQGDQSMLEYSRDALAGPLRELQKVLQQVGTGSFRPDETRSGRWSHEVQSQVQEEQGVGESGKSTEKKRRFTEPVRQVVEEEAEGDGAGESSAEESESTSSTDDGDSEGDTCALEPVAQVADKDQEIWLNVVQKTIHKGVGDGRSTACGNVLSFPNWRRCPEWPSGELKLCGRSKCFGK